MRFSYLVVALDRSPFHSAHLMSFHDKEHSHGAYATMLNRRRGKRHKIRDPNDGSQLAFSFSKSMCMNPSGAKDLVRVHQLRRNSLEGLISIAVP